MIIIMIIIIIIMTITVNRKIIRTRKTMVEINMLQTMGQTAENEDIAKVK